MKDDKIPVVITTPCLGQGGIINDEWVDARIGLFKIITLPSILNLMDSEVYWGLFIGEKPTEKVELWVKKELEALPNITVIKEQWTSKNIVKFSLDVVKEERYITTAIADDDALSKNMITTMREKAIQLIEKKDYHAGGTFANGLMWVMSDTVDVDQLSRGRSLVRKPVLVQYLFPWIGLGQFVLQSKSKPFKEAGTSHMHFPESLENEGFSIHVFDSPNRCWLYNRHQLAESSLLKCNSKPINFSLTQLQDEFGIDALGLQNWPNSIHGKIHCQKRVHRKGIIDIYDLKDMAGYVAQPYHLSFMEEGFLSISPQKDHNIKGKCRIRFYDETDQEYFILLSLNTIHEHDLLFDESMFPTSHSCRYDIQIWDGVRWTKHLPEIKIRFNDYDQNLETLNTIKRMNDISDRRIAKTNQGSEIPSHFDERERKYVSRNRLWEISVPPFKKPLAINNLPHHPENLQIDLYQLFGSLGKYRIRIRDSTDENFSIELISKSVENKPIVIHNSLLPRITNDKIDISFWREGVWQKTDLKMGFQRVGKAEL